MAIVNGCLSN